ncbi:MAG: putative zinc-binding metallopeptidase [Pirellulales bacterium]|nr:putative zinc-binding metallopeptidase [Pirellulales bacterium]
MRNGRAASATNGGPARRFGDACLAPLGDDELLDMQIRELPVAIKGTPLETRIAKLYDELAAKGIRFRPHFWLSDDWFTPDGIPGVAIPFYLAHPRLMRLERKQMLEVEGGTEEWCMRILRHEAGHAIDNAYRLRRRKRWREVFGPATQPYPQFYNPRPFSRSYVVHLDMWYAQSHPVEDFAETFAVWLKPRSRWRSRYQGWPALRKLQRVDELMQEVASQKPKVATRAKTDTLRTIRKTLRDHYTYKRSYYGLEHPNFYDRELCRLFSSDVRYRGNPTAASFLRRIRPMLRRSVARWTGEYQYTIDQVLKEMIDRCRDLRLRLTGPEGDAERDALIVLTVQIMNYLHGGYHRVAL